MFGGAKKDEGAERAEKWEMKGGGRVERQRGAGAEGSLGEGSEVREQGEAEQA